MHRAPGTSSPAPRGPGSPRSAGPALGPVTVLAGLLAESWRRWHQSRRLRRSFAAWALLGLALCLGGGGSAGALGGLLPLGLALGLLWWLLTSCLLWSSLGLLQTHPGLRPLDRLGTPNGLTLSRAYLALPVLLYAALPPLALARPLFLAVAAPIAALDAADGFIARRFGPLTVLGRALDPIMDTVFFSVCALGCLLLRLVPAWLALLVVARYALPGLGFLLLYPWLPRRPALVATTFGKISTVASALALGASSLVVLAGGPAGPLELALGLVIAASALGHLATLAGRALRPEAS